VVQHIFAREAARAKVPRSRDLEDFMNALHKVARRRGRKAVAELAAPGAHDRLARDVFDLRKVRGMTQRQLAAKSGIQQAEISRIEAGSSNPTLTTIAALSYALDAELSLAAPERGKSAKREGSSVRHAPRKPTKFLCLVCAAKLMEQMTKAKAERHLAQYRVFTERLRKRGQLIGCNRLLPAETATTVRVRNGKVSALDGPFAETKELIGGYFIIEASDRAEAVRVASRIPGARIGCVEVRPIAEDPATLRALGLVGTSTAG
jgi:DNA-binding XRE family transcriptional regulator